MPHHTDTMAMFYNKRMFEEAGIRIPTSVEDGYTWEELTDIARTLKENIACHMHSAESGRTTVDTVICHSYT